MLVSIGKRAEATDAIALMLECHERIRKFLGLARALAEVQGASAEEIRTVAAQVRRYFSESLPLHVADEHEDIAPRLAAADEAVARAIATMEQDHDEHAPLVARLVALCEQLVAEPAGLPAIASELGEIAGRLTDELGRHLELEEQVIFPALRRLPASELDAIRDAMRARRSRA